MFSHSLHPISHLTSTTLAMHPIALDSKTLRVMASPATRVSLCSVCSPHSILAMKRSLKSLAMRPMIPRNPTSMEVESRTNTSLCGCVWRGFHGSESCMEGWKEENCGRAMWCNSRCRATSRFRRLRGTRHWYSPQRTRWEERTTGWELHLLFLQYCHLHLFWEL